MNILAGSLIFLSLTYIGFGIENYYKMKVQVFYEFLDFIDFANNEISYLKTDIISLIKKFHTNYSSKFSESLLKIENPNKFSIENYNIFYLSNNEKQMIITFIQDTTKIDFIGQKQYFESYKNKTKKHINKIEEDKNIKGGLAKKLAPLLGIGILIILI